MGEGNLRINLTLMTKIKPSQLMFLITTRLKSKVFSLEGFKRCRSEKKTWGQKKWSKKILDRKIFGRKKLWVKKKFWSEKFLV